MVSLGIEYEDLTPRERALVREAFFAGGLFVLQHYEVLEDATEAELALLERYKEV